MNQQIIEQQRSLQIVQAFSEVVVPESLYKGSNIARLVQDIEKSRKGVESSNDTLSKLRTAKERQSLIDRLIPWGESPEEKIQGAHLNLNRQMATLAQHSSELLVVNTALSKVLCDQQQLLLDQQGVLARQTEDIESQNDRIKEGQKQLAAFQAQHLASNEAMGLRMVGVADRLEDLARRVVSFELEVASAHARTLEAMDAQLTEMQATAEHAIEGVRACVGGWRAESDHAIQTLCAEQRLADSRLVEQRERAHRDHEAMRAAFDELHAGSQREIGSLTKELATLVTAQSIAQTRMETLNTRVDAFRRLIPLVAAAAAAAASIATWLAIRL